MRKNPQTESPLTNRTEIKRNALLKLEEQVKQQIKEITVAKRNHIISFFQKQDINAETIEIHINKILKIICGNLRFWLDQFTEDELIEVVSTIDKLHRKSRFVVFCLNRDIPIIKLIKDALA